MEINVVLLTADIGPPATDCKTVVLQDTDVLLTPTGIIPLAIDDARLPVDNGFELDVDREG